MTSLHASITESQPARLLSQCVCCQEVDLTTGTVSAHYADLCRWCADALAGKVVPGDVSMPAARGLARILAKPVYVRESLDKSGYLVRQTHDAYAPCVTVHPDGRVSADGLDRKWTGD